MTTDEPATQLTSRHVVAAILVVGGLGLVALSFIWANVSTARSAWSQEQALEYQATSSKLHSLSHQFAQEAQRGNDQAIRAELEKTRAEYGELRAQLEGAMARPARIAFWLRIFGLLLIAAALVSAFWQPGTSRGDQP